MTRHLAGVVAAALLFLDAVALAAPPSAGVQAPGRVIVKLAAPPTAWRDAGRSAPSLETGDAAVDDVSRRHGARALRPLLRGRVPSPAALAARFPKRGARGAGHGQRRAVEGVAVIELPEDADVVAIAHEYERLPGVVYAEPDLMRYPTLVPNDPYFSSQGAWGQPYGDLWGLHIIDAESAWDVTRGEGVVVAVTDTGCDYNHPDLVGRMWTNPSEIPNNGIDDDGNGYVDDVRGWDFSNGDNDPMDDDGHGTHVSGTIAAAGNNGIGVVGVAWGATIMPLKGIGGGGAGGTDFALASAIEYAVDNGADVINASWGSQGRSNLISDAIADAHAAGVVFVASAGNNNADVIAFDFWPAADPNAITVAASNHTDARSYFSNYGSKIDITAPGGGDIEAPGRDQSILSLRATQSIYPLVIGSFYTRLAGTSMAAPHVSGAAALILAVNPGFSVEQVRQALRVSADDVGPPGVDNDSGFGRLNVGRAVHLDDVLSVQVTDPRAGAVVDGVVTIVGTVSGASFASYVLEYGSGSNPTTWLPVAGPFTTPVDNGPLGSWDVSPLRDGQYVVRVRATSTEAVTFEYRAFVILDHAIISAPQPNDMVGRSGAAVEIRGTASGTGFQHFVLEQRVIAPDLSAGAWTATGITLAGGGVTAVNDDLLGSLDPSAVPAGRYVDFRLTVTTDTATLRKEVDGVIVDPTLRAGWPIVLPDRPQPLFRTDTMRDQPVLADLDHNGTTEILLASRDQVYVFEPDGTPRPGWPQTLSGIPNHKLESGPTVADLDGDGRAEIVVATTTYYPADYTYSAEAVYVFHDDGTAMAGWPRTVFAYPSGSGISPTQKGAIVAADVDGDGRAELVLQWRAVLDVVRGDGTSLAGFPIRVSCGLNGGCFEGTPAVGDMDGDGRAEIAVVASTNFTAPLDRQFLHVYNSSGQLVAPYPKRITSHRIPDLSPVMADLDGDGRLDLVFNSDKPRGIHPRKLFGGHVVVRPRRIPTMRNRPFESKQDAVTVADVDGDGVADVLVSTGFPDAGTKKGFSFVVPANGTDYLAVLTHQRTFSGWNVAFPFSRGDKLDFLRNLVGGGPGPAAVGDIDGDGRQDVVVGLGTCDAWRYPNDYNFRRCYTVRGFRADGTPLPGFPKATKRAAPSRSVQPALGDLDGNGLTEVVWVDASRTVYVWNIPGAAGVHHLDWPMPRHDPGHTGVRP